MDLTWDAEERDAVAAYLARGTVVETYRGYSPCRLCDLDNGFRELSDGRYVWPEGLRHYVLEHGVRLPEPFVAHVLAEIEDEQSSARDGA